jgi:uncharacterized hydrophobic protein (TIGR00341 family)
MAQRLIHAVIAATEREITACLEETSVESLWMIDIEKGVLEVTLLLDVSASEDVLDKLEHTFAGREHFRLVLLTVEASLPRPENPDLDNEGASEEGDSEDDHAPQDAKQDANETTKTSAESNSEDAPKTARVSREELYNDVSESITVSWRYVTMVVLSTVVAAAGMLRDNVAVIIGAMVIAPLLGANVALSLATTLADIGLARRAIVVNALGLAVALLMSVAVGWFLPVSLESQELAARTSVSIADVGVALASGVAGALAFTGGAATTTIGVMVAVALLPPWVAVGLLLGAGNWQAASGALLLFGCNVICVNLAGVVTFLVQGLRPAQWREAQQAKWASRIALLIWIVLLGLLLLFILLAEPLQT